MSQWTHVVGCIRLDGLPQFGVETVETVRQKLSVPSLWEKWNDNTTLPCGSEGSLDYRIIEYDTGMPWVVIPIWGDLRDYNDGAAITKWWEETLKKFELVRDGCLTFRVEGQEPITLTYKGRSE